MQNFETLQPILIQDKTIVGVLLPNTNRFAQALKEFMSDLAAGEYDDWDKELSSKLAHKRYDAIIADSDANNGWMTAKDAEKEFLIS